MTLTTEFDPYPDRFRAQTHIHTLEVANVQRARFEFDTRRTRREENLRWKIFHHRRKTIKSLSEAT